MARRQVIKDLRSTARRVLETLAEQKGGSGQNSLFLVELFAGADQAGAVEDDDEGADVMQHGGNNRIQQAETGQRQADDDEQPADAEILVNDCPRATREPDKER